MKICVLVVGTKYDKQREAGNRDTVPPPHKSHRVAIARKKINDSSKKHDVYTDYKLSLSLCQIERHNEHNKNVYKFGGTI